MNRIIAIENDDVTIGMPNGEIRHFNKYSFNFVPQVNMMVNIYESNGESIVTPAAVNQQTGPVVPAQQAGSSLLLVAFILNLLTMIGVFWLVVPLVWMIPMTVLTWGAYKGTRPNTVAFGVCTLLFFNVISGILMLIAGSQTNNA